MFITDSRLQFVLLTLARSSRGGLVVEQWSNNRLISATVDQIPLGAMIYIQNKKEYKAAHRGPTCERL